VNFWGGVLSRTKRAQVAASFRHERKAVFLPRLSAGKLTVASDAPGTKLRFVQNRPWRMSGPFVFDDPEKLTDGRGSKVFAATGGGYLWRDHILILTVDRAGEPGGSVSILRRRQGFNPIKPRGFNSLETSVRLCYNRLCSNIGRGAPRGKA
jgi:hypothetical protein